MNKQKIKALIKFRRKNRVASVVRGSTERPRLSVYRSLRHIYVQVIDDTKQNTLLAIDDQNAEIKKLNLKTKADIAYAVGEVIADKCLEANIKKVVFDRGASAYQGRVKSLAEGARKKGLDF